MLFNRYHRPTWAGLALLAAASFFLSATAAAADRPKGPNNPLTPDVIVGHADPVTNERPVCVTDPQTGKRFCARPLSVDTNPLEEGRIYKCVQTPKYQYCALVTDTTANTFDIEKDIGEILTAEATAKTGTDFEVQIDPDTPLTQCGNGHGRSACCRIIGSANGITYIECGR